MLDPGHEVEECWFIGVEVIPPLPPTVDPREGELAWPKNVKPPPEKWKSIIKPNNIVTVDSLNKESLFKERGVWMGSIL